MEGKDLPERSDRCNSYRDFHLDIATQRGYAVFHAHKQNEETYIILSGKGDFQVDDQCFPIQSGSVVRVAPEGSRSMRNTANEPMHYIVVQAKQHSLEQFTFTDATILEQAPLWK